MNCCFPPALRLFPVCLFSSARRWCGCRRTKVMWCLCSSVVKMMTRCVQICFFRLQLVSWHPRAKNASSLPAQTLSALLHMLLRTELGSVVSTRLLTTSKLLSGNKETTGFRVKLLDYRQRKEPWEQMDVHSGECKVTTHSSVPRLLRCVRSKHTRGGTFSAASRLAGSRPWIPGSQRRRCVCCRPVSTFVFPLWRF